VISAESDDDSSHFIIVRPEQKHRAASDDPNTEHLIVASRPMADSKCLYGIVARVVYSRSLADRTRPQTGRLNKSPHTVARAPRNLTTGSTLNKRNEVKK
jgi:hypothetical protein